MSTQLNLQNGNQVGHTHSNTCAFDSFLEGFVNVLSAVQNNEVKIMTSNSDLNLFIEKMLNNDHTGLYTLQSKVLNRIYGKNLNCVSNVTNISDGVLSDNYSSGSTKFVCHHCNIEECEMFISKRVYDNNHT